MELKHTPSPRAIGPGGLNLGEGPMWDAASQRFFYVDIHGCTLHAWSPEHDRSEQWTLPERICWLVPRRDGDGFIAGLQSGFVRLWTEPSLRWEPMGSPHAGEPQVRLNDAKADARGRIWAGSMNNDDASLRQGRLTRLDADGQWSVMERDIYIANGPAIAADGSWMLHTDSFRNTVYRYDIAPDGGLSGKREWLRFGEDQGTPDGMNFDRDGNVWIAFWGGSCIRQFTPDAQCLRTVALPAPNITCVAFGGKNLDLMLVTSARAELDAATLARYPEAGNTWVLELGVQGVLPCTFG
jgi:xylono-1,5-lactonase